ncbi:hypothetical protein [Saccharopolyspora cebuensis]|uniref:hypothetical protein n=1 Tax=Saccharopolyspora cebuensis TaxID=418759 RepID=UPI0031EB9169
MVLRLPWTEAGHSLSVGELNRVTTAISAAMTEHGISLEQARAHAESKVRSAHTNPPRWVIGGFADPDNLPVELPEASTTQASAAPEPAPEPEFVPWCQECRPPVKTPHGLACSPDCTTHAHSAA